jgi:hypothetical protein
MSDANAEQSSEQSSEQDVAATPVETSTGGRPTAVTAAVVIAFFLAFYELLTTIGLFLTPPRGPDPMWYAFGVVHLLLAVVLVLGGLNARRGNSDRLLVGVSAAAVVVLAIKTVFEIVYDLLPVGWLILVAYGVMVYLLMRPTSKAFFARSGPSVDQ